MKRIMTCVACVLMALMAQADVKLPKMFGDNMVLQQQSTCNLWGTATANKMVKVKTSWDGRQYSVKADEIGHFQLKIQTPAAGFRYLIN